jgi:integrase
MTNYYTHFAAFAAYSRKMFRNTTARQTIREINVAYENWLQSDADGDADSFRDFERASLTRFHKWASNGRVPAQLDARGTAFAAAIADWLHATNAPKRSGRKLQAVSLDERSWFHLQQQLAKDQSPEARVLLLEATTGHRIGDLLRLKRNQVEQALGTGVLQMERKDGRIIQVPIDATRDQWESLYQAWPQQYKELSTWVAPRGTQGADAGGAAYTKCLRRLKALGAELGIKGRIHTHRLRRTVAVAALDASKDIKAVADLLGHKSVQSTEQYTDEFRRDEINALQQKILKR